MNETCQRCGNPGEDRRTLLMGCFYRLEELGIPFGEQNGRYALRVCKRCRGEWMQAIKEWFHARPQGEDSDCNGADPHAAPSCGSGIFVRENGTTREVTEEEWFRLNPGREPARVKPSGDTE